MPHKLIWIAAILAVLALVLGFIFHPWIATAGVVIAAAGIIAYIAAGRPTIGG